LFVEDLKERTLVMTGQPATVTAAETGARPTRAQRLVYPLARDVVKAVAEAHGACIRPIQLRKTNLNTGQVEQVMVLSVVK